MTNRERLLKTAVFDTLIEANARLALLTGRKNGVQGVCVLEALDSCGPSDCTMECADCIQKWLNEEETK